MAELWVGRFAQTLARPACVCCECLGIGSQAIVTIGNGSASLMYVLVRSSSISDLCWRDVGSLVLSSFIELTLRQNAR